MLVAGVASGENGGGCSCVAPVGGIAAAAPGIVAVFFGCGSVLAGYCCDAA